MTPAQIALIRASAAPIVADPEGVATLFYDRLFALAPGLRPLFPADMAAQRGKLMAMLITAVGLLDQPEKLVPALQQLGKRHVAYGVKPEHYPIVGAALLDTLAVGLGAGFTPEVRAAWTAFYGVAADTMIAASTAA